MAENKRKKWSRARRYEDINFIFSLDNEGFKILQRLPLTCDPSHFNLSLVDVSQKKAVNIV